MNVPSYVGIVLFCKSISLLFGIVVNTVGGQSGMIYRQRKTDDQLNPAYLNPDVYRESIASLVSAKERAEELLYKNDMIAQLVTEMPNREMQNRLLISGTHKEVGRLFEKFASTRSPWNCGKGFGIYELLEVVQKSRERPEPTVKEMPFTTSANVSSISSSSSIACMATVRALGGSDDLEKSAYFNRKAQDQLTDVSATFKKTDLYPYTKPSETIETLDSTFPLLPIMSPKLIFERMHVKSTTLQYPYKLQYHKKYAHKNPSKQILKESDFITRASDNLLRQPLDYKPPMMIPIFGKSGYLISKHGKIERMKYKRPSKV